MKNTAKMDLFLIFKKIKNVGVHLEKSPTVRKNVPSGHFERKKKKKKRASFFLFFEKKNRTLNMFFFYLFGLIRWQATLNLYDN